jgi:osmotically-inducible protein OsmY
MEKMTDKQIQREIFAALEPQIGSTEIGVAVQDGVVTLLGYVDSHRQREFAEQVARDVYGVRAVVNELRVMPDVSGRLSDLEIALRTVWALETHNTVVPTKRLQMTVRDGRITLEGEVSTVDQREVAETIALCQPGVRGVTNLIAVQPQLSTGDVDREIEEALRLNSPTLMGVRYARRIGEGATDSRLLSKGGVRGWTEREDAEQTGYSLPGGHMPDVAEAEDWTLVTPG